MREILFRGKRTVDRAWVKGFFCGEDCDTPFSPTVERANIIVKGTGIWNTVDRDTVGQFTGMKDIKGKQIFEGDIVSFKRVNALGYTTSRVGDVRYYDELPIFYIMATTGDAWDWVDCEEIEVIGNVSDNPELLEG